MKAAGGFGTKEGCYLACFKGSSGCKGSVCSLVCLIASDKGRWCRKVARRDQSLARSWHDRHESARIGPNRHDLLVGGLQGHGGERGPFSVQFSNHYPLPWEERQWYPLFYRRERGGLKKSDFAKSPLEGRDIQVFWPRSPSPGPLLAPQEFPCSVERAAGVYPLPAGIWHMLSAQSCLEWGWRREYPGHPGHPGPTPILFTRPRAPHLCWL